MSNTTLAAEAWEEGLLLGNHLFYHPKHTASNKLLPWETQTALYKWECLLQNDSLTFEIVQCFPYFISSSDYKCLYIF